jgi:hypothetical protein
MKKRAERSRPKTIEELETGIRQVWDELALDTINPIVDEMPRRLGQVKDDNGSTIQRLMVRDEE